jgi:hypothetical protein
MEFTSDRDFQMWRYTVSHGQLLLRSVRTDVHSTRVDVLFKNVSWLDLPSTFTGLTITQGDERFALTGRDWHGSVTAGACFTAEDEGAYDDPSPFESSFGGAL